MLKLTADALPSQLLKLYSFILKNRKFLNSHIVDFITNNQWGQLDENLQGELSNLQPGELLACFGNASNLDKVKNLPAVTKFVQSAYDHSWQKLMGSSETVEMTEGICIPETATEIASSLAKEKLFGINISNKKAHEVSSMAQFVAYLAQMQNADLVVDFGTGKGYLSSLLALFHDLRVVGIESSEKNVCGATCWNKKMTSHFVQSLEKSEERTDLKGAFVPLAAELTDSTDLLDILRKGLAGIDPSTLRSVFCGLHACGNLSSIVLRHFVSYPSSSVVCLLGCCYHLLDEMYEDDDMDQNAKDCQHGFPMSNLLQQEKAVIGRNARMIAQQSVERQRNTILSRSLFYRSLLQVLLRDHFGTSARHEVGRVRLGEDTTFEAYVRQALKKLRLQHLVQPSAETIESYLENYREWERKLNVFQEMRILVASSVECLLTLDRALYLLEQPNIESCSLVRLFDPLKSPRCLAIVASKSL